MFIVQFRLEDRGKNAVAMSGEAVGGFGFFRQKFCCNLLIAFEL